MFALSMTLYNITFNNYNTIISDDVSWWNNVGHKSMYVLI